MAAVRESTDIEPNSGSLSSYTKGQSERIRRSSRLCSKIKMYYTVYDIGPWYGGSKGESEATGVPRCKGAPLANPGSACSEYTQSWYLSLYKAEGGALVPWAGYTTTSAASGRLRTMCWPPQSPDLNPIEQIWELLKSMVNKNSRSSKDNLWRCVQDVWNKISPSILKKYIDTMPKRLLAVIEDGGGHTKY